MSLSFNPAMSSSLRALRHASTVRTRSVGGLASGEKQNLSSQDAGAFIMATRLDGNRRIESSMLGNLQSLISFPQSQDTLLSEMSTILSRIGELASYASNPFLSDAARNANENLAQIRGADLSEESAMLAKASLQSNFGMAGGPPDTSESDPDHLSTTTMMKSFQLKHRFPILIKIGRATGSRTQQQINHGG